MKNLRKNFPDKCTSVLLVYNFIWGSIMGSIIFIIALPPIDVTFLRVVPLMHYVYRMSSIPYSIVHPWTRGYNIELFIAYVAISIYYSGHFPKTVADQILYYSDA